MWVSLCALFILNLGFSSVGIVTCVLCRSWVITASLRNSLEFVSAGIPEHRRLSVEGGRIPRPVQSMS